MRPEEHDIQRRAARNQSLFREVNERVQTLESPLDALSEIDFCCECADAECAAPITMTAKEYEALRTNPRRFAVRPEHVAPEAELVVAVTDAYWTVEKIEDAGHLAAALDPRAATDGA